MNRTTSRSFTANEKEIEKLLREIAGWKENLSNIAEEINFLQLLLRADVFEPGEDLFESLQDYYDTIIEFRSENRDLNKEAHNHRYDVEGILECEDISCEVFYHEEHVKLGRKIEDFTERFRKFKLEVFSYTGKHLKQHSSS